MDRGTPAKPAFTPEGIPRAIIPAMPAFVLTPPPRRAPSREDFILAELRRRFGGEITRLDPKKETIADPELLRSAELQEPEWTGGFRGQVSKLLWRVYG